MTAADYPAATRPRTALTCRLTEAPGDAELTRALTELGTAVVEELVADVVLTDLAEAIG